MSKEGGSIRICGYCGGDPSYATWNQTALHPDAEIYKTIHCCGRKFKQVIVTKKVWVLVEEPPGANIDPKTGVDMEEASKAIGSSFASAYSAVMNHFDCYEEYGKDSKEFKSHREMFPDCPRCGVEDMYTQDKASESSPSR